MTPKRRKLLAAATRDVQALHEEWLEALSQHQLRVEAQFQELARRSTPAAKGRQPAGLPSATQAQAMLAALGSVHLKPKKGRAKDLRAIERLLQALVDALPPQE